jgi:hypothetical protein
MRRLNDLTGARFGALTVTGRAPSKNGRTYWECQCDCGNVKIIESYHLQHDNYISCGCRKKPSPKKINMIGERFGMLTVIEEADNLYGGREAAWKCKCDCGNTIIALGSMLRRGSYKSCGCQRAKRAHDNFTTHGKTKTRIYKIWLGMRQRCYYSNYIEYYLYGGRGIKVCDDWRDNFSSFYEWAMTSGYSDNLTIDRINVNGDYEPVNCRWVTGKAQANNRRNNHYIKFENQTHTMAEWARIKNIPYSCLEERINKLHWTIEDALNIPSRGRVLRKLSEGK